MAAGSAGQRIDRALAVLVEQLGMEVAYVSEFRGGERVVTHSVSVAGGPVLPVGTTHPVEETLCHLVASGGLPVLVGDTAADAVMSGHPHTAAFGVAAHAGVPLTVEGRVHGALCCAATTPARTLNPRDEATLNTVAGYLAGLLTDDVRAPGEPGLRQLADAVAAGQDLQTLTRPLLQLLQDITGLESTFLTLVDTTADELVVAYAHNSGNLVIAEGGTSSWQESLCRRALDEGRADVTDVPATWPSAAAARQLGIISYVSVPVRDAHDELLGTLCGASSNPALVGEQNLAIMATFAQLLSAQLARETAHHLQAARATVIEQRMNSLREAAERDSLTALCNRAGIHRWLHKALDQVATGQQRLAVAFIDLDRFKAVNDTYGHATGDEVLRRLAASLARTGRAGDLHGRLGGDEFIVAALLPADACVDGWTSRVRAAAVAAVEDVHVSGSVGVVTREPGTPATSVEYVLDQADQAMYQDKHATARTA
ncbi:diguanylate cyclase [Actinoplanes sp. NPDC023801]|uniref:diguanylate cyclase n=1 Tax=Actinoplanes sp. NPDC023801 TaxID=3154595 RepID=UPI0033E017B3